MNSVAATPVAAIEDVGSLGVVYLKRLWSHWVNSVPIPQGEAVQAWRATHVLCSGLGIGLEPTVRTAYRCGRDFAVFENWVREQNSGKIDPQAVERINAALRGHEPPEAVRRELAEIDALPPVLTDEDLEHWNREGWVRLSGAIPPEACAASADVIWQVQGMDPDDPATWGKGPKQQCVFVQEFRHPVLDANRRSRRIHKAMAQLWGHSDLWMTCDRVGFNPPERPDLPFPGPGMHWDVSLSPPVPFGIQGILYLTDTPPEQGAFALSPGMHRYIDEWVAAQPQGIKLSELAEQTLPLIAVGGAAGDLILWHHALLHGPTPNHGTRPRLVQYMTMFPADFGYVPEWR